MVAVHSKWASVEPLGVLGSHQLWWQKLPGNQGEIWTSGKLPVIPHLQAFFEIVIISIYFFWGHFGVHVCPKVRSFVASDSVIPYQPCSTQPNKSRLGSNCSLVPSVPMDDVGCLFQWRDCNAPAQELVLISGFWYVYHLKLCMSCTWPNSSDDDDTTSWPKCQGSFL